MLPVHPRRLPLSVCILAYDEERNIADCLESVLGQAGEVVVLDAQSGDRTADIVRRYATTHPEIVLMSAPNQPNFDANKALTFKQATQEWLFYLDADERMTPALWQEIASVLGRAGINGYRVGRKNMMFGRWMRYGGMYPELQPRLFRRGTAAFPGHGLHETLQIEGEVRNLQEPFIHYAYVSVSQFLIKMNRYTDVQATGWRESGMRWSLANHIKFGFARPAGRFVQKYILLAGLRDGFLGFFAAWMAGFSEFIAYVKVGNHV